MSERMRVIWAIGLIAAVGCGAFFGLRALAAGGQQTTMESGLSVPAQSDGAGPQSAPVVADPGARPRAHQRGPGARTHARASRDKPLLRRPHVTTARRPR